MKEQERHTFPAVLTYEPGEEIAVPFPDLGVATSGETDEEALLAARELLGCVLYGLEEDGEPIPAPTPLDSVRTESNEHAALVDVFMPAVRQAESNRSVNRTVTLPAWLNALAVDRGINFSQTLQSSLRTQLGM